MSGQATKSAPRPPEPTHPIGAVVHFGQAAGAVRVVHRGQMLAWRDGAAVSADDDLKATLDSCSAPVKWKHAHAG